MVNEYCKTSMMTALTWLREILANYDPLKVKLLVSLLD